VARPNKVWYDEKLTKENEHLKNRIADLEQDRNKQRARADFVEGLFRCADTEIVGLEKENHNLCVRIFGKQATRDIEFRIDYWDNACGNALELYTNCEMIVTERITPNRTKTMILDRIFSKIKTRLLGNEPPANEINQDASQKRDADLELENKFSFYGITRKELLILRCLNYIVKKNGLVEELDLHAEFLKQMIAGENLDIAFEDNLYPFSSDLHDLLTSFQKNGIVDSEFKITKKGTIVLEEFLRHETKLLG